MKIIKLMAVVGARPNFMKVAPIIQAIKMHNDNDHPSRVPVRMVLVHTGQHYDELMSDRFFSDLNLPKPDVHLGVSSGSHATQTAEIMKKFEEVLLREQPDVLVVVGDVNSTLACALVAAKTSYDTPGRRPLIAHVEAGLRSFDRKMPEEINRILTDQLSDLLFVTEESGVRNLANEGVQTDKVHLVGNTMIDSLLAFSGQAARSPILEDLGLRHGAPGGQRIGKYALLTLHRPSNVDNRAVFADIVEAMEELAKECQVIFPVHPRTRRRIDELGLRHVFELEKAGGIRLIDPLGYLDFACLLTHASLVVTDSGGIQEEAVCLGVPCVTVRDNTERPITLTNRANVLAGTRKRGILVAARRQFARTEMPLRPPLWDGNASTRIIKILTGHFSQRPVAEANARSMTVTQR